MIFKFTIITRSGAEYPIDDPIGWDATKFTLRRSDEKHGFTYKYQADDYYYTGEAFRLLDAEYEVYGIQGKSSLKIEAKCTMEEPLTLVFRGNFDFNSWDDSKGDDCGVNLHVEDDYSEQILANMADTKVNLQATQTLAGTAMTAYSKLPMTVTLPSKSIAVADNSENKTTYTTSWKEGSYYGSYTAGSGSGSGTANMFPAAAIFVPGFDTLLSSEIGGYYHPTGSTGAALVVSSDEWMFGALGQWSSAGPTTTVDFTDAVVSGAVLLPYDPLVGLTPPTIPTAFAKWHYMYFLPDNIAPIVNYDSTLGTVYGGAAITGLELRIKFKASFAAIFAPIATTLPEPGIISAGLYCGIRDASDKWKWISVDPAIWAQYRATFGSEKLTTNIKPNLTIDKDITISGITLNPGDRLYFFYQIWHYRRVNDVVTTPVNSFNITYHSGNIFKLSGLSKTAATTSKLFLINEALSRVVESITDNKMRVYSSYFGRTDSQPYALGADGCGSLEGITNGLFVRRLELKKPTTPPIFNKSFNELWEGLNPIHNLGCEVESDPSRPGFKRLRIERWDYFYSDDIVLECYGVKNVKRKVKPTAHYNTFTFGYSKWEAEQFNGIDEFLTKREYRTTLNQLRSTLNLMSSFIASGFALEVTRRIGNDKSEDFKYDNDTFIICMKRVSGVIVVEQGGITSPENIIDPDTIYNWRIRPLYNAMRWAPYIFASYKNFGSGSQLIFTDGTGNFYAKGKSTSAFCKITDTVLSEKDTITPGQFLESDYPIPIWELEDVVFEYPMTVAEFNILKANPRGQIYYENDSTNGYGWIRSIDFSPYDGMAQFTLKPKR